MKNLAGALIKAQSEMAPLIKATKGNFGKYATLADVQETCLEALGNHGIAVFQAVRTERDEDGRLCVVVSCKLVHAGSGESWDSGDLALLPTKPDPQGAGSAITYGRRYALMAAAGIAPEDDDGTEASKPVLKATYQKPSPAPVVQHRNIDQPPPLSDEELNEAPSMSDSDDQAAVWAAIPGAVLKSVTPAPVTVQTSALAPLTSEKLQQFVTGCAAKQAKAPKPCSDKQYPLLVRVIDEIGGKGSHNSILSYLCDKEQVDSDNRPGWELTSFLLNHLMKDARGEDGKYGPNPNYKPEYAQAILQVAGMVREMA